MSAGLDVKNREKTGPTHVRRVVIALLVLHYANTYLDRVAISQAAPVLRGEFHLSQTELGLVFTAFTVAYALFQLPGGWLADRFGPRRILTGIVTYWSIFTMATAAAWNTTSLVVIRFLFGAGEAGAFPSATRAFSRWLPKTERGMAQGVAHSGARLAGALAPPLAALIITSLGWRAVFLIFGAIGFLWAVVWYGYYRDRPEEHHGVNEAELALIRAGRSQPTEKGTEPEGSGEGRLDGSVDGRDQAGAGVDWKTLFASRNMWLLSSMYFCYVYTFWIYLTWMPSYLVESRGFSIVGSGFGAGLPLLAGAATNAIGGWTSDRLSASRGLRFGRRVPAIAGLLIGAGFILPGVLVANPYVAVASLTLAAAGLEFTTGISWAVAIDVGEERAGTVSATMNMFGNLGGALSPLAFGLLVDWTGHWELPFIIASGMIVVAALLWLRIDPERSVLVEEAEPVVPHPALDRTA